MRPIGTTRRPSSWRGPTGDPALLAGALYDVGFAPIARIRRRRESGCASEGRSGRRRWRFTASSATRPASRAPCGRCRCHPRRTRTSIEGWPTRPRAWRWAAGWAIGSGPGGPRTWWVSRISREDGPKRRRRTSASRSRSGSKPGTAAGSRCSCLISRWWRRHGARQNGVGACSARLTGCGPGRGPTSSTSRWTSWAGRGTRTPGTTSSGAGSPKGSECPSTRSSSWCAGRIRGS